MPAPQYAREIPQRYRLEAARCTGCQKVAFPPRPVCLKCRGEVFETEVLPDDGTLLTWTVIHVAPHDFAMQAPYVVGVVELAHGVRITAQIAEATPEISNLAPPFGGYFGGCAPKASTGSFSTATNSIALAPRC